MCVFICVCPLLGFRAQRLRSGRTPVRDTASYTFEGDGGKNSTTEPQMVRRGYEHGASGAQLSPSGGHRGPSEGGQTWPQIAQLPRSVFTGWAVKFGLGALLLSETPPPEYNPSSGSWRRRRARRRDGTGRAWAFRGSRWPMASSSGGAVGGARAGDGSTTGECARAWGWLSECGCDAGRCARLLIGIVLRSGGVCVRVNVRFVCGVRVVSCCLPVLRVVVCLSSLCVGSGSRVCPVRG